PAVVLCAVAVRLSVACTSLSAQTRGTSAEATMHHAGGLLPCFATGAFALSTPPSAPSIQQQQQNRRQLLTRASRSMHLPTTRKQLGSTRLNSWGGESGYDYV
ncbi:unnamed protein product, partial [Laminaria digitata]